MYIGKFFEFSYFFELFQTNVAQNLPQLEIWPKKWIRLGQNGQVITEFVSHSSNIQLL